MRTVTRVGPHSVHLTKHAVERYVERIKHIIDPTEDELERFSHELCFLLRREGAVANEPPDWIYDVPLDENNPRDNEFFIIVGDCIAFPVTLRTERKMVLTTLTRGGFTHSTRNSRNVKKQRKRETQRKRRQYESWRGERHPRWQ